MCAAMITFTFLNKDKNQLLFNLLYVAAMVFAFLGIAFFGLWIYMLGSFIVLPFGIVGIVRAFRYEANLSAYEASLAKAEEAPAADAAAEAAEEESVEETVDAE